MKTKIKERVDIMKALKDTGRIMYVTEGVAKKASQNTGELEFFHLDRYIKPQELADEYEKRGLEPASILSLCEYDKTNRVHLDEMKWVVAQWKDEKGRWCFVAFDGWGGERHVSVRMRDDDWYGRWWFAGVRKPSESSPLESSSPLALGTSGVEELETVVTKINYKGRVYVLEDK